MRLLDKFKDRSCTISPYSWKRNLTLLSLTIFLWLLLSLRRHASQSEIRRCTVYIDQSTDVEGRIAGSWQRRVMVRTTKGEVPSRKAGLWNGDERGSTSMEGHDVATATAYHWYQVLLVGVARSFVSSLLFTHAEQMFLLLWNHLRATVIRGKEFRQVRLSLFGW